MNYIWDIVLQAKQNGIKKSELFFKQGKDISPWYEQSFSSVNQKEVEHPIIEINAFHRFDELFGTYLHEGFNENLEFKKYFFDLAIHFLSEVDLANGISEEGLYLSQIEEEIENGLLGNSLKEYYRCFHKHEKDKITPLILKQLRVGCSLLNFRKALKNIYPDVLLYQLKEEPKKLLVYLGIEKNEVDEQKMRFLEDMFLPLGFELRIFWDKHFGVIGVDATLILDEIELL